MKHLLHVLLFLTGSCIISCATEKDPPAPEVIEEPVVLTDSVLIEHEIVTAVFQVPEIKHRIAEKEKRNPGVSSTTISVTHPEAPDNLYYTAVVDDLADDDSTWYVLAIFHVYYPPLEILYFDTLTQRAYTREQWQNATNRR